jgi:hypothetical protein
MNNPWYNEKNPYITGDTEVPVYCDGPLVCVLDGNNAPFYSPENVFVDIEYYDRLANEYLEIGNEARWRYAYLQWKRWGETHK